MHQLTLRLPEALADRLKAAAADRGDSVNGYATAVLAAATDPALEGDAAVRVRERLARAGLLARFPRAASARPADESLSAARRAAGQGTPLSDLVRKGRG